MLRLLLILIALAALAEPGLGLHGGNFQPPPPYEGPGDTGAGGGKPTQPGGGPAVSGGGNQPGGPGSGPSSPGPGAAGGPASGVPAEPPGSWAVWWEFNKDPYLQLKRAIHAGGSVNTGDVGFFTGRGQSRAIVDSLRPSAEQVAGEAVPALRALLAAESNPDVVTGCLLALARIGEAGAGAEPLGPELAAFLESDSQEVRETAALALGVLGSERSIPLLGALAADTAAGRAAVGRPEVDPRTRTFAAYGLGLLGARLEFVPLRRQVVRILAEQLPAARAAAQPDLAIGVVTALGLTVLPPDADGADRAEDGPGPAWTSLEAQIEALLQIFEDRRANWLLRAHAPLAAARLIETATARGVDVALLGTAKQRLAESLLERLDPRASRDDRVELRQSAVQALGRLGDCDRDPVDAAIRKRLLGLNDADRLVERFALIALARVGARDGASGDHAEAREEILEHLLEHLEGGRGGMEHWGALALGVLRRDRLDRGLDDAGLNRAAARLQAALAGAKSVDDLAAFAIANGVFGNAESRTTLRARLRATEEPRAKGYLALALGMLGDQAAKDDLRAIVERSNYRPELLRQASTALGLLGDKELAPLLAGQLGRSGSVAVQAAAANAMGAIGDRRSIEPLLAMLADAELPDLGRAFAAAALGLVCDREPLPWNSKLRVDVNYRAAVSTLNDPAGKGLLNLL